MANKKQEPIDHAREIQAALAYGESKKQQEIDQLKQQLEISQVLNMAIGHIQVFEFYRSQSYLFLLLKLRKIKKSKEYIEKYHMTWEQLCTFCGQKRRTIDEHIADIKPFSDDFLRAVGNLGDIDFNKIKYLGMDVLADSANFRDGKLYFENKEIPLNELPVFLDSREQYYKEQVKEKEKSTKKEINSLKGQLEEVQIEKGAMLSRIKEIEPYVPKDIDEATIEIFTQVADHLEEIDKLLRHFMKIPVQEVQGGTIAKIEGIYKQIQDLMKFWHTDWADHLIEE